MGHMQNALSITQFPLVPHCIQKGAFFFLSFLLENITNIFYAIKAMSHWQGNGKVFLFVKCQSSTIISWCSSSIKSLKPKQWLIFGFWVFLSLWTFCIAFMPHLGAWWASLNNHYWARYYIASLDAVVGWSISWTSSVKIRLFMENPCTLPHYSFKKEKNSLYAFPSCP